MVADDHATVVDGGAHPPRSDLAGGATPPHPLNLADHDALNGGSNVSNGVFAKPRAAAHSDDALMNGKAGLAADPVASALADAAVLMRPSQFNILSGMSTADTRQAEIAANKKMEEMQLSTMPPSGSGPDARPLADKPGPNSVQTSESSVSEASTSGQSLEYDEPAAGVDRAYMGQGAPVPQASQGDGLPRDGFVAAAMSGTSPADYASSQGDCDCADEEDIEDYREGGYHPCQIGETFKNGRYVVMRKLGWGYFSTVWLAKDVEQNDAYVAVKVVRAAQNYTETAIDEIQLLQRTNNADPDHLGRNYIVSLYDQFIHVGPNGAHVCMVFEVLGENLLSLMKRYQYQGVPPALVKQITKQVFLALDYLHRKCGIIHTDLKPENVLIKIKDVDRVVREVEELTAEETPQARLSSYLQQKQTEALDESYKNVHEEQQQQQQQQQQGLQSREVNQIPPAENGGGGGAKVTLTNPMAPLDSSQISPGSIASTVSGAKSMVSSMSGVSATSNASTSSLVSERLRSQLITGSQPLPSPLRRRENPPAASPTSSTISQSDMQGITESASSTMSAKSTGSTGNDGVAPLNADFGESAGGAFLDQFTALEDERITVKIADFGNACSVDHHFTDDIQTRQYRAPEVLLATDWGAAVDCWSTACMVFELLTGDYLFEPQGSQTYTKDEDHMAQIVELLGPPPANLLHGKNAPNIFDSHGRFRNIHKLKEWVLYDVFYSKYGYPEDEVRELVDVLLPLLVLDPEKRADCGSLIDKKWLRDARGLEQVRLDRIPQDSGMDIRGWSSQAPRVRRQSEAELRASQEELNRMWRAGDVPANAGSPPDPVDVVEESAI